MRVLIISRCPPYPLHLGDRLIVWHLARELSAQGVTLDLLAFAQHESDWHEQDHYRAFFQHVQLIQEPTRTPLGYLGRVILPQTRFPKKASASWSPPMWEAITAHLQDNVYDAVHLFGSVQVYEFLGALAGAHAIITPYESFTLFSERVMTQTPSVANRARWWIARAFEGFMFTPYAHTVVVAEPDQAKLQQIQPALNLSVLPNGVDTAYFAPLALERHPHTLLFVGNYEYAPNVDAVHTLVRHILPAVRQHIPQVRVWLVGNAPPPELQAYASENVIVTGRVEDIRPYLAQATAFVCPLRIGAGIKNKVLEALAMGVPVVATPLSVDGIHVIPEESALITEINDMAQSIIRLLHDSALQAKLSQEGQQLIQTRYSWRATAEGYLTLYHS